jgi:hypothetical protein
VRELEAWIARNIRFDVHVAAAAAPLGFGETRIRVLEAEEASGRGKKVVYVTHEFHVQPEAKGEERTFCHGSWKRADQHDEDSPGCDRSVLGVVVVGPGYGQAFPVCVNKDCDIHWADEKREKARREKLAGNGDARRENEVRVDLERSREQQREREEKQRAEWMKAVPAITEACVVAVKRAKPMTLASAVLADIWRDAAKTLDRLLGAPKTAEDLVRRLALHHYLDTVNSSYNGPSEFPKMATPLGIDVAAIVKAANQPKAEAGPAAKKAGRKATTKPSVKSSKRR